MSLDTNQLQSYYDRFKAKHAKDIAEIYAEFDRVVRPFPKKKEVTLTLYHGTTAKSAESISQRGFSLQEKRKNSGGFDVGEFGNGVHLTTKERVANWFGSTIIRAKAKIKNPVLVKPKEWETVMTSAGQKILGNVFGVVNSLLETKKTYSYIFNKIIKDYFAQKQIGGVFCEDFVNTKQRKLNFFKQRQWIIFDPQNIQVLSVSKKLASFLKLKFGFNISRITHMFNFSH